MYSSIWTCSIWFGHVFLYIVVLILWFRTCFEVGMNLRMDNFLYDIIVVFEKLCISFYVWHMVCLCS